jgi:hypothetical protein
MCRRIAEKNACPKCGGLKRPSSSVCDACTDRTGLNNGNWKGGVAWHRKGYVMCRVEKHPSGRKYFFEHVLVMEKALGRFLCAGENVHHKNGIRDDNRIENLELWCKPHPTGIRVTDALIWAKSILERYG